MQTHIAHIHRYTELYTHTHTCAHTRTCAHTHMHTHTYTHHPSIHMLHSLHVISRSDTGQRSVLIRTITAVPLMDIDTLLSKGLPAELAMDNQRLYVPLSLVIH